MNYYSHHIGDYRRDTAHLSLLEHGVYRQLLDMYYLSESKIPAETEAVYRRLCARTDDEKRSVDTVLSEFFRLEGGWVHTRCDKEIAEYQGKAERARNNGKLGGRPTKTKVVVSENPEESDTEANHKPITKNQEPEEEHTAPQAAPAAPKFQAKQYLIDLGVSEPTIDDWLKLRKSKKAPVTLTAIKGIEREATKADYLMEDALKTGCERGWAGFKADWVSPTNAGGAKVAQNDRMRTSYDRTADKALAAATNKARGVPELTDDSDLSFT